jgi:putative membrane protein
MPGFVVRLLITAFGLWIAAAIVPGIEIDGPVSLLAAALLLGVVNALVRPIVVLLTLPLTLLTFGLFLLVVNGCLFALVAAMLEGVRLSGFGAAVLGALIVSVVGGLASWTIGPSGRIEVLIVKG